MTILSTTSEHLERPQQGEKIRNTWSIPYTALDLWATSTTNKDIPFRWQGSKHQQLRRQVGNPAWVVTRAVLDKGIIFFSVN